MSSNIICPNCKIQIEITEVMSAQLTTQIRTKLEEELRPTRQALDKQASDLKLQQAELEQSRQAIHEQVQKQLAGEREKIVQDHARDPRWRWIFRFALSWTEREHKSETLVQLAHDLIRYGNPFLVYDALDEDRLVLPDEPIAAAALGPGGPAPVPGPGLVVDGRLVPVVVDSVEPPPRPAVDGLPGPSWALDADDRAT